MRRVMTLRAVIASVAFAILAGVGASDVKGEFAIVEDTSVEILSPSEMASVAGRVHTDTLFLLAPPGSFIFPRTTTNPVVDFAPSNGGPLLLIDLSSILNAVQPQRAIALLGSSGLLSFPLGNRTAPLLLLGLRP